MTRTAIITASTKECRLGGGNRGRGRKKREGKKGKELKQGATIMVTRLPRNSYRKRINPTQRNKTTQNKTANAIY